MVKIDEDEILLCPKCNFNYLHHGTISVFTRSGEDQPAVVTTIGSESLAINNLGNPSSRRDGIRIAFTCEGCDLNTDLTIVQHKGCTYVRWDE